MKVHFSAFLLILAFSQLVLAQDVCQEYISLHCANEKATKDAREILKCLAKHQADVSSECKQEIQRLSKVFVQPTPPGGGPLSLLGGMTSLGGQVPMLSYDGTLTPGSPAITENNLRLLVPVYKTDVDTIATSASAGRLHLDESLVLDSGIEVPDDLYRVAVGLQYTHRLPEKRTYGVQGSFGYSGDKFNKKTETYTFNANYSYPGSKTGHWVLMLLISNNSPFGAGIPIPGFFYIHKTETFTGVFGLPILSMQWTPINPWSFSLSGLGPLIKSEVSYGTIDKTQFFTGLSWNQQRFLLTDRENEDDRLTIEDKKAEMGLRRPLSKGIFAELRTGYSFDRTIYMGEGLFDKESGDTDLDSSWFLNGSIKFLFC